MPDALGRRVEDALAVDGHRHGLPHADVAPRLLIGAHRDVGLDVRHELGRAQAGPPLLEEVFDLDPVRCGPMAPARSQPRSYLPARKADMREALSSSTVISMRSMYGRTAWKYCGMPHEREADVRAMAVQHPRARADDGLGLLEIAELFDRLAGHDGHGHRVGEHLEEPGVHFLEHDPHRVRVRGLDAVDRPQHVGARVALDGEEALDRVLHIGRRQLAPVHGRLRVPANTAAQLEDVRRLVRLRPRLGEVALDRERPRRNRRPARCRTSRLCVKLSGTCTR
jgi:hypothetical protein